MDCVFCKIIKGDIPCYKVYEDDKFLGFLDNSPRSEGHSLLVPKEHYRWVYDIPNFGEYWEVARKLSRAIQKIVAPKYISYFTFGTEVPHAHIHIMPMQTMNEGYPVRYDIDKEKAIQLAKKIFAQVA